MKLLPVWLLVSVSLAAGADKVKVTETAGLARVKEPVCVTLSGQERCLFVTIGPRESRTFTLAELAPTDPLKLQPTNGVGFEMENAQFHADLSPRIVNGKVEDSGTLRGLLFKPFQVRLERTQNRMHWAPSFQRVGARNYSSMAMWTPVQKHSRQVLPGVITFTREGHHADYPEIQMSLEYKFFAHVPYFLFRATMDIVKPIEMFWLRNQEMTMDDLFTDVAWPGKDGQPVIVDFESRKPLLKSNPLPADIPWVAFLNRKKGYGYGAVVLGYSASKTAKPVTSINDGANNGKYWDRRIIDQTPTHLDAGEKYVEHTAFVLFRVQDQPLEEFLTWEKKLRNPVLVQEWK